MAATKRDHSGVFKNAPQPEQTLGQLHHNGLTFVSPRGVKPWTELGVRICGGKSRCDLQCHGVVVECARRRSGAGYDVAMVFVDLPRQTPARRSTWPEDAPVADVAFTR